MYNERVSAVAVKGKARNIRTVIVMDKNQKHRNNERILRVPRPVKGTWTAFAYP